MIAVASGGDTARLIGRHGQTIDAVQHLAAAAALPGSDGEWEIVVDTAGYRVRRERRLRALALKAADASRARRPRAGAGADVQRRAAHRAHRAARPRRAWRRRVRDAIRRASSSCARAPEPGRGLFHVTQRPRVSRETASRGRPRGSSRAARRARAGRARPARAARGAGLLDAGRRHGDPRSRRGGGAPRAGRAGRPAGGRRRARRARWRTSAAAAACRVSCSRSCAPSARSHLIEATARKAAFIAEAAAELGLRRPACTPSAPRISPAARCATPAPASWRARWRRRRWPPSCACRCAGRAGASCCGRASKPDDELAFAAAALGGEVLAAECPGVLVIGKRRATPERFPRRPGMAAKRPLARPGSDRPRQ